MVIFCVAMNISAPPVSVPKGKPAARVERPVAKSGASLRSYMVRAVSPGRPMAMGHMHMQIPMHVGRAKAMDRRGDMGNDSAG
jgi:hypothetical protein